MWRARELKHSLVRVVSALGLVASLGAGAFPATAAAQPAAAFCQPNESPSFHFGFADLKFALGYIMGDPIECEHPNSDNGDTLQQTTTGLAVYVQATNTPEFTDGWNHWALSVGGVVAWSGTDQPGATAAAPPVVPAASTDMPCVDVGAGVCLRAADDLSQTITMLAASQTAVPLLRTAGKAGYLIHYGNLPQDVLGLFRPKTHDVVVNNGLRGYPVVDRGPVIAHELQHVSDWVSQGAALDTPDGCIATETQAFHTESAVWLELRGGRLTAATNDLEQEFNTISQAIASDPNGFAARLTLLYHDECSGGAG